MSRPEPATKRDRLLAAFPELHDHGKPALLLHPHLAAPSPKDSSVGGPLLWPSDEPWPTCPHGHYAFEAPAENGDVYYDEPLFLQPVLQLFARDLPAGHTFPESADLLQVLWCPNDHPEPPEAFRHHYGPSLVVRWRFAADITKAFDEQPRPHTVTSYYERLPACGLSIEAVDDYPSVFDLPEELAHLIDEDSEEEEGDNAIPVGSTAIPRFAYVDHIGAREGMKFGGYPSYGPTDPFLMTCECGAELEHLLQIDSPETGPLDLALGRGHVLCVYRCPRSTRHPHRINLQ
ncbi:hypothetical protein ABZ512_14200 [Nocardiopsis dassonvillei]|uniref:hypothetical protein n=1 Tax=Nocardiopsis dassonvillei TaxID=2014 RepID=UPI0033EFEEE4